MNGRTTSLMAGGAVFVSTVFYVTLIAVSLGLSFMKVFGAEDETHGGAMAAFAIWTLGFTLSLILGFLAGGFAVWRLSMKVH